MSQRIPELNEVQCLILGMCANQGRRPKEVYAALKGRYSYNYIARTMNELALLGVLGKSRGHYKLIKSAHSLYKQYEERKNDRR